jgi:hypothetical protein
MSISAANSGTRWRRWLLVVLAVSAAYVGVWAMLAPAGFYRSFPGLGWTWVATAGPYDEHLVRDVGELNLALLVVTVAAAIRPSRWNAVVAGLAWLAYGVPHLVFHATHVSGAERIQLVPLTAVVVLAALLLLPSRKVRAERRPEYISGWM